MTETTAIAPSSLASASTTQLRAELARMLAVTAEHVRHLALVWRELERRGEDLSALRGGIGAYLAPVAYGRLLPEAVVKLAGNRAALRAVALLTPDEQSRVLDAGAIAVRRDDTEDAELIHLTALKGGDIAKAIDPILGVVRPPGEQRAVAARRRRAAPLKYMSVKLSEREHNCLQGAAQRLKISASKLIYDALKENGYLD